MHKWIEDSVDREPNIARKRVKHPETVIQQDQEDMRNTGKAQLTSRKPETTLEEMLNPNGDSLSDCTTSDNGEDGEDEDDAEEDTALCNLSYEVETSWVLGRNSKMVEHRMTYLQRKQMKFDEFTQPDWGDTANYIHEIEKNYCKTELKVPDVVQPQTEDDAVFSAQLTYGEPIVALDSIPGKSQIQQVTCRPGSGHMRLKSRKPQTQHRIASFQPIAAPDSSPIEISNSVQTIRFFCSTSCP